MSEKASQSKKASRVGVLLTVAALFIILAGMREAQEILLPFLIAVFLAVVSSPAVFWMTAKRVPRALAVLLVVAAMVGVGTGLAALIALVSLGPYPISMVSVRGDELSNSLPPTVTLLALGVCQSGLLLALEKPARRLLQRGALWTATVLINSMIMTIFLWHVTALLLVSGLAVASGIGLSFFPGTPDWWLTRPLWIAAIAVALIPFVFFFTRFERIGQAQRASPPPAWRLLLGCAFVCFGLSILTLRGIPTETWPGINLLALGLPFIGAALVWFNPRRAPDLGK